MVWTREGHNSVGHSQWHSPEVYSRESFTAGSAGGREGGSASDLHVIKKDVARVHFSSFIYTSHMYNISMLYLHRPAGLL